MSREPPRKKTKLNEEPDSEDENEGPPGPPILERIRQLAEEPEFIDAHFESIVGDTNDNAVNPQEGGNFESFGEDEIKELLRSIDSLEAPPSGPNQELVAHFFGARNDLSQGTEPQDSHFFLSLRRLLPDVNSDFLVGMIWQLIGLTERPNPRVRMIFPGDQSSDDRFSQSSQSTAVSSQVMSHSSSGKTRGPYKCWKCGAPMKGHTCLLPMEGPGLFVAPHDRRRWWIFLVKDVIEDMNDAAEANGAGISSVEEQCDKDKPKTRENFKCGLCGKCKKSSAHQYCVKKRGENKTTLGADGKTWYYAIPAGSDCNSKAGSKEDQGEGKLLENKEEEDPEDDRKPVAKDLKKKKKKSDSDGGKGDKDDNDDDSNDDPPNKGGDNEGGFEGVARYPV